MAVIIDDEDRKVDKMSDDELAWCRKADRLFAKMPSRLKLVECGDSVMVIDGPRGRDVELHDGNATRNGVVLAWLTCARFKITGVSG